MTCDLLHRCLRIPHVYCSQFIPNGQGGYEIDEEHSVDGIKTLIVDEETFKKVKEQGYHVCTPNSN